MAGTTTNFAIPYPSVTDYVTNGATDMRLLAEKVDAVMSSGTPARNLLINGAMQIAQRSSSVSSIAGAIAQQYYTADRYATTILGTAGTWTQSVATTADDYPTGSGFRKSLKMLCTTPTTPLAAGGLCFVNQRIEGQNLQAIRKGTASAQTLTLSFWVKSGVTGTYTASLYDFPNNRQVGKTYTIAVANTWEYKTLLFPADITGAFNNDSSVGLQVAFGLAAGSTYSSGTTQTTWGTYVAANEFAGQVNVAAGNNSAVNYWQMTGAQLTVGSVSVPFEFKSFADDLRDCQRYFYKAIFTAGSLAFATGYWASAFIFYWSAAFPVTMRRQPDLAQTQMMIDAAVGGGAIGALTLKASAYTFGAYSGVAVSGTAGQGGILQSINTSSSIQADAEL